MPYTPAQIVENIDTAVYQLTSRMVESYSIGGISYRYNDLEKLAKLRSYYARLGRAGSSIRLGDLSGA
jgi:hypothetical protein